MEYITKNHSKYLLMYHFIKGQEHPWLQSWDELTIKHLTNSDTYTLKNIWGENTKEQIRNYIKNQKQKGG